MHILRPSDFCVSFRVSIFNSQIILYVLKHQTLTEWFSWPFWRRITEIYLFGGSCKEPHLLLWGVKPSAPRSAAMEWMENPHACMRQALSPWGVASGGCKSEVKELPLKGTGAARCRPPRCQAWLRDHRASTRSDERPTGKLPPASTPCTMGQQPYSDGQSASF